MAHRRAGTVFFGSMLVMAGIGAGVAPFLPERVSVLGGLVALYLVATAWLTVRRPPGQRGHLETGAAVAAIALVALTAVLGSMALRDPTGTLDGQPWQAFVLFGVITPLAAAGDLRLLLGAGPAGAARIARHLWRMCMALFIAVTSYFLGQPVFLPPFLRGTPWVYLPSALVLAAMGWWLLALRFSSAAHGRRRRPAPGAGRTRRRRGIRGGPIGGRVSAHLDRERRR